MAEQWRTMAEQWRNNGGAMVESFCNQNMGSARVALVLNMIIIFEYRSYM